MDLIFQFARILVFCLLGELCNAALPFPVPASVYGLILLLAALILGIVRLEQVRTAAVFLTGIFPLLFVPAAAGVMELWTELQAILIPIIISVIGITILVMVVGGWVTQLIAGTGEEQLEAYEKERSDYECDID